MVAFRPIYEQLTGDVRNRGIEVRYVDLDPYNHWKIDPQAVMNAVDENTKVIHIINPNNPTGQVVSQEERDAIIAAASKVGAWIVADEVYIGTERDTDEVTKSFWGDYDKVVVLNSMSKAYGLPGLRLGWMVAPKDTITASWRRHEYATVAATTLSMRLAEAALAEPARGLLVERARRLIRTGFETLTEALKVHEVYSPFRRQRHLPCPSSGLICLWTLKLCVAVCMQNKSSGHSGQPLRRGKSLPVQFSSARSAFA